MLESKTRSLRKDAALNRDRLLAAAGDLFAEHGLGITLDDIARHAGVGVGTAYRRFANKEEVIDALFERRLHEVAAVATDALDDPDAWRGVVTFLERTIDMQIADRGLTQIMNNAALGDARVSDARDRIAPLMTKMVERAKQQHVVRGDFDQTDLVFIQVAEAAVVEASRAVSPDLYRRYLTMLLDGIRTDRETFTRLPVAALSANQTHTAMRRKRRDAGRVHNK